MRKLNNLMIVKNTLPRLHQADLRWAISSDIMSRECECNDLLCPPLITQIINDFRIPRPTLGIFDCGRVECVDQSIVRYASRQGGLQDPERKTQELDGVLSSVPEIEDKSCVAMSFSLL
jgi:hypothetical protein